MIARAITNYRRAVDTVQRQKAELSNERAATRETLEGADRDRRELREEVERLKAAHALSHPAADMAAAASSPLPDGVPGEVWANWYPSHTTLGWCLANDGTTPRASMWTSEEHARRGKSVGCIGTSHLIDDSLHTSLLSAAVEREREKRDEADRKLASMGGAVLTVIGDKVQPLAKVVDPEAVADAVSNRLADVERERDEARADHEHVNGLWNEAECDLSEAREALRDAEDRLGRVARDGLCCDLAAFGGDDPPEHELDCPLHGWTRKTETP